MSPWTMWQFGTHPAACLVVLLAGGGQGRAAAEAPVRAPVELQVLLWPDPRPAAGVMVAYFPDAERGLRGRADGSGKLRLVSPEVEAPLVLALPGWTARTTVPGGHEGPLVRWLYPTVELRLAVQTADGAPAAGHGFALLSPHDPLIHPDDASPWPLARGVSDDLGQLVLADGGLLARLGRDQGPYGLLGGFWGHTGETRWLDPAEVRAGPIRAVVEESGRLQIATGDPGSRGRWLRLSGGDTPMWMPAVEVDSEGHALFRAVALSKFFHLEHGARVGKLPGSAPFPGPETGDSIQRVESTLPDLEHAQGEGATPRGPLVWGDGAPVGSAARGHWLLRAGERVSVGWSGAIDDRVGFQPPPIPDGDLPREGNWEPWLQWPDGEWAEVVPQEGRGGRVQLAPTRLALRLVGPAGEGRGGLRVRAAPLEPSEQGADPLPSPVLKTAGRSDPLGFLWLRSPIRAERWSVEVEVRADTWIRRVLPESAALAEVLLDDGADVSPGPSGEEQP